MVIKTIVLPSYFVNVDNGPKEHFHDNQDHIVTKLFCKCGQWS